MVFFFFNFYFLHFFFALRQLCPAPWRLWTLLFVPSGAFLKSDKLLFADADNVVAVGVCGVVVVAAAA